MLLGKFILNGIKFLLIDVGGQRNERRKWINCFEEVKAILFVVGISEYDQVLFEDESINRLQESLSVFDDTINNQSLRKINVILFLNKIDIFEEKIKKIPLNVSLEDYAGETGNYNQAVDFIKKTFIAANKNPRREIYVHLTLATDANNVDKVFKGIQSIVIKESMDLL